MASRYVFRDVTLQRTDLQARACADGHGVVMVQAGCIAGQAKLLHGLQVCEVGQSWCTSLIPIGETAKTHVDPLSPEPCREGVHLDFEVGQQAREGRRKWELRRYGCCYEPWSERSGGPSAPLNVIGARFEMAEEIREHTHSLDTGARKGPAGGSA